MTINNVIISGRLVRDPELRYTSNTNTEVANFTVAVDRYMGEGKDPDTDFIPVIAWGNTAKFITDYFFKGKKIIVQGNLRQRSWEDKDGKKRSVVEVWAEKIDFADDKKKNDQDAVTSTRQEKKKQAKNDDDDDGLPVMTDSNNGNLPAWLRG